MSQRSKLSLLIFQTLIFSLFLALFGRLFYLQVLESGQYKDAAVSIQSRDIVTPAVRGAITDINGVPMVVDLPGLVVSIDRSTLDNQPDKGISVLARTAALFNLEYSDIYQRTRLCGELPKDNRAGCWNGTRYQPIPLVGGASQDLALKIMENSDLYPGIEVQSVPIRSYPSLEGENVAHVLGYVGSVTDEDLKNPDESYYRNEVVGKTGIEIVYNQYLRGIPGVRTVLVNRKEVVTKQSKNIKAVAGNNLITNIDAKLQAGVEKALADAIKRARGSGYKGDSGAAVVLEIKTGRVLAMASYPTYDPAIWQKGLTVKQAEDLFSEAKGVPALSRPLQGLFAPASTFKSISVTAAANAGYSLTDLITARQLLRLVAAPLETLIAKLPEDYRLRKQSLSHVTRFGIRLHMMSGLKMAGLSQKQMLMITFLMPLKHLVLMKKLELIYQLSYLADYRIGSGNKVGMRKTRIFTVTTSNGHKRRI